MAKPDRPRPRLSDVLYADILAEITSGKLQLGMRLPSEAEFSERFQVSRPIVRESLGRLREDGLIRSRKGAGSYVIASPAGAGALTETPGRSVASLADVQSLFLFRIMLEGSAAEQAAQHHSPEQLRAIAEAAEDLARTMPEAEDGTEEDIRFHRAIAVATNNRFYVDALDRIAPDMRYIVYLARSLLMRQAQQHIHTVQHEHSIILAAIRERNAALAGERMRFHIQTAQSRLFFGDAREGISVWNETPPG